MILFLGGKKKYKLNISYPSKFEHTVHVTFDPSTGQFVVRLFCHCNLNMIAVFTHTYIHYITKNRMVKIQDYIKDIIQFGYQPCT